MTQELHVSLKKHRYRKKNSSVVKLKPKQTKMDSLELKDDLLPPALTAFFLVKSSA